MKLTNITNQLRDFAHDELVALADWCQSEATKKDPVRLKELAAYEAHLAKCRRKAAEVDAKRDRITVALKGILKPGVRLKMKGCKDGHGLREFIRWDEDRIVCWQILRYREWKNVPTKGQMVEEITNQVTTHMSDKVQEIYVNGTGIKVQSILK